VAPFCRTNEIERACRNVNFVAKNQEENLLGELREAEFLLLLPVTVMIFVIIIHDLIMN
jgi:hypothetical protein